jgi:RNA polymerase sigma-70 factor (ECF subfamily)
MSVQPEPSDAFEAVVRRAGPAMLAYARRRVDAETAQDVVADALLVLWRRRHELAGSGGPERERADEIAWAIGVTRGCLANAQRSSRRHLSLVGRLAGLERPPPMVEPSSDPDTGPDDGPDAVLHAALASLRKEDQELLRLWAWDDLRPAQIAVVLDTTPEVVSVRLHRAKKRLGALLEGSSARTSAASPH